jgi:3-deoxy-7-phosphoheptulonate synthase
VAGLDYARRLKALADELSDTCCWSCASISRSRAPPPAGRVTSTTRTWTTPSTSTKACRRRAKFLLDVNELGLPAAHRGARSDLAAVLGDLIAWTAIGARTTESQTHREMSSACRRRSASRTAPRRRRHRRQRHHLGLAPHSFLGINGRAAPAIVRTAATATATSCCAAATAARTTTRSACAGRAGAGQGQAAANIVVDCSHANSYKKPELQPLVMADVVNQIRLGNRRWSA